MASRMSQGLVGRKHHRLAAVPFQTGPVTLHDFIDKLEWEENGQKIEAARKRIPFAVGRIGDGTEAARRYGMRYARREAKLLLRARHDHVVGVIKTHLRPEQPKHARYFCIVMPYAKHDLTAYVIPKEPRPIKVQWFGCLINAVAHVHELGIWHRDIKPANILVQDENTVLLADFGISKVVWQDAAARARARAVPAWGRPRQLGVLIKQDRELLGTPGYLAPEVEGFKSAGGLSADIFSLGLVFLEMVAAAVGKRALVLPVIKPPIQAGRPENASERPGHVDIRMEEAKKAIEGLQMSLSSLIERHRDPSQPEASDDLVIIRDLGILKVCRAMLEPEPHLRPTADDLRQWWRLQLLREMGVVERECVCACNNPAADGGGGDGVARRWRYSDFEEQPNASLKRAYENGHRLVVEALRFRGARMDDGAALVAAARGGLWDEVEDLVGNRCFGKVAVRDDVGRTALHYLAGAGDLDGHDIWYRLADKFLKKDPDAVLTRDLDGRTPLRIAAEHGSPDMIWRRVRGEKGEGRDGRENKESAGSKLVRFLCYGVIHGIGKKDAGIYRREVVSGLLCCGSGNGEGETLGADAYEGMDPGELVQLCQLFEAGELIPDDNGQTPLSIAAMHGREAVVRLLLSQGANANARDKHGRDPLSMAAAYGHDGVASLLLEWHAAAAAASWTESQEAINRKDKDGQTPLFKAADRGHPAVVRLLLEHDADVEAADTKSNDTALVRASEHGHGAIVGLLLEDAADGIPEMREAVKKGLEKADSRGHWSVKRILLAHYGRGQQGSSKQGGRVALETRRAWELFAKGRAALVTVLPKAGVGTVICMAALVMAALIIAASALGGLRLYVLPPHYGSGRPVDPPLGGDIGTNNRTRVPSPVVARPSDIFAFLGLYIQSY